MVYRDPAAKPQAAEVGRDELHPPPEDLNAALLRAFSAPPTPLGPPEGHALATRIVRVPRRARFADMTIVLDLPWRETRRYEHSKLYYSVEDPFERTTDQVICFRVRWLRRLQTVRLLLPEAVRTARYARFWLDPLPYCHAGTAALHSLRLAAEDEHVEASRLAEVYALKEQVRHQVEAAESAKADVCHHYPSALSIELTARCNLTCSHCSSHGEPDLHVRHNRKPEMEVDRLERLADEVFPSLTAVGLVGRGEPLATSNRLWGSLVRQLRAHRVFLTAVTNGTFLPRRITPDLLPFLETLTVSVDGATPQTFGRHRGGARLERVLENVAAFHELRKSSGLTRAPRLGFSWTLMRDNVREFASFIRAVAALDPDLVYARHLLVFHERTRAQSLLGHPELANEPLREAYELMAEHGIRSDCPPLLEPAEAGGAPPRPEPWQLPQQPRDRCMFVHRTAVIAADGEVPTCSAPFAAVAGRLDEEPSFARVWNGDVMRAVRSALDTDAEWDQCANCWYREGRYQTQRDAADRQAPRYDLGRAGKFTTEAWDFSANAL